MPRIAKRLYGPAQLGSSTATRYTVPSATLGIIRHIHVSNPAATIVNFTMSIGSDSAGTRIFDAFPIGAGQVLDHYCYYTLLAAEIVAAHGSVVSTLVLTINGEESVLG